MHTGHRRPDRRLIAVAWLVAAVGVASSVAAVPLAATVPPGLLGDALVPSDLVLATVWPVVGALVVRAQPRNPVGWLMLVPAVMGPYQLAGLYAAHTGGAGPLGGLAAWVAVWGFAPYFFTLPVLPHLFPDGRPISRGWRRVLVTVVAVAAVTTVARMFAEVAPDLAPAVDNPLAPSWGGWLNYVTAVGAGLLFFVGIPLAVLSLAVRLRRSVGVERTRLQWFLLGGVVLLAGVLTSTGGSWGLTIGLLGLPLGIGIAMLRHGLFDVALTLNRTLVFGLLTGLVVGAYALVVYGVQAVAPGSRWGIVLVGAAALAAAAGRDRVQALVDRWLFGHRHNPYAVVSRVGRHVAEASQPLEALQRLVDGLREALRLPSVAFTAEGVSLAAGSPVHGSRVVPAEALGESVGELHVGLRSRGERWSAAETAAIEEVAARAGTLAYAAGLVTDVALSRGRIVAAREEERRRLRGDLHDGVAPSLAGAALQLESLARRLDDADQPALARRTEGIRDGLRDTVGQLRALVHGLRPPVLDQLGLPGALRQLVAGHETPACTAEVGRLGPADAAVEVAAYAIASEAFTNALRHSAASRVTVRAAVSGGELVVTVADNGIGLPARPRAGVGSVSMRERAAEVGGRLDVVGTPGGGTTVRAALPLEVA